MSCATFFQTISAQDALVFLDPMGVETSRYADIAGSPYIFSDFVKADVLHVNGKLIHDVLLNINAYEDNIEVEVDGRKFELDDKYYISIVVDPNRNDHLTHDQAIRFVKGLIPDAPEKFAEIVYDGIHKLLKEYYCITSKFKVANVDHSHERDHFIQKQNYYLQNLDGNIQFIKLKEKSMSKLFPKKKFLQIVETEKLNLSEETDLVKLLARLDRI